MRRNTEAIRIRINSRHDKVFKAYQHYHNEKRIRFDDVVKILADEFDYSEATIMSIIRTKKAS